MPGNWIAAFAAMTGFDFPVDWEADCAGGCAQIGVGCAWIGVGAGGFVGERRIVRWPTLGVCTFLSLPFLCLPGPIA